MEARWASLMAQPKSTPPIGFECLLMAKKRHSAHVTGTAAYPLGADIQASTQNSTLFRREGMKGHDGYARHVS